jgi:hypothetical protein
MVARFTCLIERAVCTRIAYSFGCLPAATKKAIEVPELRRRLLGNHGNLIDF